MSPEASVQHTFTALAYIRGRFSNRLVGAISLLAALLLILALIGPWTFLIAKKAADGTSGTLNSFQLTPTKEPMLTVSANQSPDKFVESSGENSEKKPSPGPKRPRGVLLKTEVNKVFTLVIPLESLEPRLEEGGAKNEPVLVEAALRNEPIPQELLRRPPPE